MKVTKSELTSDLGKCKGKDQYYLSLFKSDIIDILNTLEYATDADREEHISNNKRIIEHVEIKNNGFRINTSNYYFKGKTNIYKIEHNNYMYHVLHNIDTNNIMVYEVSI